MSEGAAVDALRALVLDALREVAPDVDAAAASGSDESFVETFGFDSVDFLNFVEGLHQRTGIEIPEREYARLLTVDGCVEYLASRQSNGGS